MWTDTSDRWPELIGGDHQVQVVGAAQYGPDITVNELPVIGGSYRQEYDGMRVRTSVEVEVDDTNLTEGDLVPVRPTDPLAPFGQQVVLRCEVAVGSVSESVPLGVFRIEPSTASGGWRYVRKRSGRWWLPTGGTVKFPAVDLWQQVVDAEFTGPVQPLPGATIRTEFFRLCNGETTPVDGGSLPDVSIGGKSVVYQQSRSEAAESLGRLVGMVPWCGRDGMMRLVSPTASTTPVWAVTVNAGSWVATDMQMTRDGIYNVVITTGEQTSDDAATVRGFAVEDSGPFSWRGPLGVRVYRQSSPFYTTNAQAQAGAETLMRTLRASREVEFQVRTVFNPAIDVLDRITVTIRPDDRNPFEVFATVTGVSWSFGGGEMVLTCTTPRESLT